MIIKNELIISSLDQAEEGEIIIHSDVDVQFFKDIQKNLDQSLFMDHDMVCQSDGGGVLCDQGLSAFCYGFMIIKNNFKTRSMFKRILELVKITNSTDQFLLNNIYKQ